VSTTILSAINTCLDKLKMKEHRSIKKGMSNKYTYYYPEFHTKKR